MCAGAIVQARIPRVVIGSMNPKAGCAGSVLNLLQEDGFNHQVEVEAGVLEEECSRMLSDFFRRLRAIRKERKEAEKMSGDRQAGLGRASLLAAGNAGSPDDNGEEPA